MYIVQAALGTAHAHLKASLETMVVRSAMTFKMKSRLSVPETGEYVDSNSTSPGRYWGFDGFDAFLAHRTAHNPALVQRDFLEAICNALRTIIASAWLWRLAIGVILAGKRLILCALCFLRFFSLLESTSGSAPCWTMRFAAWLRPEVTLKKT
jgi:hypothetical protein